MYLSHLLIDVGDNPDRPRPGRLWLRNLYRVHQRLCMAFPSPPRKEGDPYFLMPFRPEEFGNGQVHVKRQPDSGFLFRMDPQLGGRVVILVQSALEPGWKYAFQNAGYLLAAPPEVKPFDPSFTLGQRLRFRLLVNPTKKVGTINKAERKSLSEDELAQKEGRHGRRVPVPSAQEIEDWLRKNPHQDPRPFIEGKLLEWLSSRGKTSGFSLDQRSTIVQPGYLYFNKRPVVGKEEAGASPKSQQARLRSVRYEGILQVTDAAWFRETLIHGIGSGKAFGFGLLSVAPYHEEARTEGT
jgi:CRISPR system Cascade subunit CasE